MAETAARGHVVLVGMMGSGKTTVGRKVARKLDRLFLDADAELAATTGREVAEWFAQVGETGFREAEEQLTADLLHREEPSVIATGGGAVLAASTRKALRSERHTVIWLRASPEFLASRIGRKDEAGRRPLLTGDACGTLQRLDEERRDLYAEVADVVIDIEAVMTDAEHPRKALASLVVTTLSTVAPGRFG